MTDITVIILIKDEILHIRRCLEKLTALEPRQIFVVDSPSSDGSDKVAAEMGATVVVHQYPGNQAAQFNWGLDNLSIEGKWILRLDADEYLDDAGCVWLKENLAKIVADVDALELTLERKFCGGAIRHATNGIKMVRIFRRGKARYAETLMDERLVNSGETLSVPVVFWDDNLNSMDWWRAKHRGYAKREAEQAIAGTFQDPRKARYYKLPRYFRAFAYFCIRYFLKGGILDGYAGWMWNFWQGLWYRCLVDREIGRLKRSV